jgi:hypothetical protein
MMVSDPQTELRKGRQIIADSKDEELVQVIESTPKDPFLYRRTKLYKALKIIFSDCDYETIQTLKKTATVATHLRRMIEDLGELDARGVITQSAIIEALNEEALQGKETKNRR